VSVALIRSPESVRDVENIVQYFIDQKTPATAIKFGKAVMKTLDFLATFPGSVHLGNQTKYGWKECVFNLCMVSGIT